MGKPAPSMSFGTNSKVSESQIRVEYTPLFVRFVKHLAKKYRSIQKDLQSLVAELEQGDTPGDQVPGTRYAVYKVRVRNSDVPKGKSGGYRVIYYLKQADLIVLLAMYAKTERLNLSPDEIKRMIEEYDQPDS